MHRRAGVDDPGRVRMVDVGDKPLQRRLARATGTLTMATETVSRIEEDRLPKGDVLTVAQIAGLQAAKQTAYLIPLCHPLVLDRIDLQLRLVPEGVVATSEVGCTARTGAEMEALIAVSVALLTVYDMCKAVDLHMRLSDVFLVEKAKYDVAEG